MTTEVLQKTAPLTFGQMSVWRDVAGLPRERWQEANIFHRFDLPGVVSRRRLCEVLSRLQEKYESLRTVYDLTDPRQPRQRVLPSQPFEDVPVAYADSEDVKARFEALHRIPFDVRADRLFRPMAIATGEPTDDLDVENVTGVGFSLHHMAADGWSIGLLVMDTIALLGLGGEPQPEQPSSLLEVAEEQRNSSFWQAKTKATQRYFRSVYETGVARLRDRDPALPAVQATIESSRLHAATQAVIAAHNVTLSTLYTAVLADSLSEFCTPGPVRLGLMTGNRFTEKWRHYVTSLNQLIPLLVDGDPTAELAGRLNAVQVAAMRAFRLGHYDVDQVTPAALGLDVAPADVKDLCMLNVMDFAPPELAEEPDADGLPTVHWEPLYNNVSTSGYLRVYETTGGTVRLRLRLGGVPQETVRSIVLGMYRRVLAAAG